jgi:hypothetical protein
MWDLNEVIRIEYKGGYVYHILFDNNVSGEVDFAGHLGKGPVFHALRDLELFSRARIEGGTIAWPNGADIAPETLYEMIETADERLHPAAHRH